MVKHSPEKRGTSNLMTDGEFEDFWLCLDAHRQFYATHGYPHQPARLLSSHYQAVQQSVRHAEADGADAFARGRYKSSQRCGTCRGCTSSDCGQCKNCKDKPRFGGPGIKKKACLRRLCLKAHREMNSDDEADEASQPSPTHPLPTGASTTQSPFVPPTPVKTNGASEPTSELASPMMRPSSPEEAPLVPVHAPPLLGDSLLHSSGYGAQHAYSSHAAHEATLHPEAASHHSLHTAQHAYVAAESQQLQDDLAQSGGAGCHLDVLSRMAAHAMTAPQSAH